VASLKDIRNRINSVSTTKQITSAMKMVSAAKLKRAQDTILQMRPYANKLEELLINLSASLDSSSENIFSQKREVKNVLLIAITSNKGLCGGFNSSIIKKVNEKIKLSYANCNVKVLCVGKKGSDFFEKKSTLFESKHNGLFDDLTFENVASLAEHIMNDYLSAKWDKVEIIYNQFKNAAVQLVLAEDFLPVKVEKKKENKTTADYIFEPDKQEIVKDLIPKSLKTQLYKTLLDSNASEHGARMTAMHKATDNASDLIYDLKLHYNKARQAAITNEILEIVGGAEALNN